MDISLCLKRPASTQPHPPFDNDHYLLLSYANKDIFGDCPPPPSTILIVHVIVN